MRNTANATSTGAGVDTGGRHAWVSAQRSSSTPAAMPATQASPKAAVPRPPPSTVAITERTRNGTRIVR